MKVLNVVLGVGTAFILVSLVALGIGAFYPAPASPYTVDSMLATRADCAPGDSACLAKLAAAKAAFNANVKAYDQAVRVHGRNVFVVANLIGAVVFVAGFFTVMYGRLAGQGIPSGVMLAGFAVMIYGYGEGWGSMDDRLKFFIGLALGALVIVGSGWLVQRRAAAAQR
ncbi:MAG TPA: hypothetical protein VMV31_03930 [Terriglobales bacterium]|nr:hypothetical protein [Terriglobales bacterium]